MTERSNRAEVRNPILALPGANLLRALPPESRAALRAVLIDIRNDCRARADECWKRHKAPMAAYWKACGVYASIASGECQVRADIRQTVIMCMVDPENGDHDAEIADCIIQAAMFNELVFG